MVACKAETNPASFAPLQKCLVELLLGLHLFAQKTYLRGLLQIRGYDRLLGVIRSLEEGLTMPRSRVLVVLPSGA